MLRISAATAAASGAAALVPKKFGKVSASWAMSEPKNVVFPPSGATMSGCCRVTLTRAPAVLKKIGVSPAELKLSSCGGETPNAGVLNHGAAPTPIPPAALVWPYDVPLLVANCG